MMFPIVYSELAESDLNSIIGYIADNPFFNKTAARDFYDEVGNVLQHISKTPEMFPFSRNRWLSGMGIRMVNIRNYNMFYLFDGETVKVARFKSGLSDYDSAEFISSIKDAIERMS